MRVEVDLATCTGHERMRQAVTQCPAAALRLTD